MRRSVKGSVGCKGVEPQPLFFSLLARVNRDGSYVVKLSLLYSKAVSLKRSEMSNLNEREKEKSPPLNTPANRQERENLEPIQE